MKQNACLLLIVLVLMLACSPVSSDNLTTPVSTPQFTPSANLESARPTALRPARGPSPTSEHTPGPVPDRIQAQVMSVIDGDTIEVAIGGRTLRLRYIGVDSPENSQTVTPMEQLAQDATEANRRLVQGKTVILAKDTSEADAFGRLLRYVYVGTLFVNAELVRLGYARATPYPPDLKYADLLAQAQQEAIKARRGLWAISVSGKVPSPTQRAASQTTALPSRTNPPAGTARPTLRPGTSCDPSYPDECIPPPPPDLNCKDIPYRRFRVLPPDPHHFDMDGNGIGCESQ